MVIINERKDFSDEAIEKAWKRSGGRCEKCNAELKKGCHDRNEEGCWEAHHKDGNSENNKSENCQILCWPCHEETFGQKSFSDRVKEIAQRRF